MSSDSGQPQALAGYTADMAQRRKPSGWWIYRHILIAVGISVVMFAAIVCITLSRQGVGQVVGKDYHFAFTYVDLDSGARLNVPRPTWNAMRVGDHLAKQRYSMCYSVNGVCRYDDLRVLWFLAALLIVGAIKSYLETRHTKKQTKPSS